MAWEGNVEKTARSIVKSWLANERQSRILLDADLTYAGVGAASYRGRIAVTLDAFGPRKVIKLPVAWVHPQPKPVAGYEGWKPAEKPSVGYSGGKPSTAYPAPQPAPKPVEGYQGQKPEYKPVPLPYPAPKAGC